MKKILFVFGTRPEALKMAPLILESKKKSNITSKVCVTAQHRSMLDQVLSLFNIIPDYDLDIMKESQTLAGLTSSIISGVTEVIKIDRPDIVCVHGDTTTTMATSLACFYQNIDVAHIEAGLRTGDKYFPWPEEVNRKITAILAKYHFSPTEQAKLNLLNEGCDLSRIYVTGNTIIDTLLETKRIIDSNLPIRNSLGKLFNFLEETDRFILVTAHRRENFGDAIENICRAILIIAKKFPDIKIIFPVHMNPLVRGPVMKMLNSTQNVYLIEPQGYLEFVYLMMRSTVILTDSGGIQEEAPALGKPVLVMRDTTERPEAVQAGTVKLVGTKVGSIVSNVCELLSCNEYYKKMSHANNPYGSGDASVKILDILEQA